MSYETTYSVRLKYSVDDRAARNGVRGLTGDVKTLGAETGRVTGLMQRAGLAVAAAFGARAAGKALIGFNSTAQDTKLQIAGMLSLVRKTDLADQIRVADSVFANLQRRAKSLPGTTQEYVQMAGMLTQPIMDAGLGLRALEDLTVNSVVAAKALGIQWEVAARDVDQALRGQFHSVDQFTGKLLGAAGYKGEEGREKFNAMSEAKRAETLQGVLMQKQLVQLAAAQGATFSGALSTLQDTVGQFFGKIGLPLFKALTAEIKSWNTWIDANERKVDAIATKFADGLVTGFNVVKSAMGFIVDHADTLVMIGKVWAGVKVAGLLSNGLGGAAAGAVGGGTGMVDRFRAWADKGDSYDKNGDYVYTGTGAGQKRWNSGGIGGTASSIGTALGGGFAIGTVLNEWTGASSMLSKGVEGIRPRLDAISQKFYQLEDSITALDIATENAAKNTDEKTWTGKNFGGVASTNRYGVIDAYRQEVNVFDDWKRAYQAKDWDTMQAKGDAFSAMGGDAKTIEFKRAEIGRLTALAEQQNALARDKWLDEFQTLNATELKALNQAETQTAVLDYIKGGLLGNQQNPALAMLGQFVDDVAIGMIMRNGNPKMGSKPNVNVTIQRIEVQSDDPDRFAFGLVEAFTDAVTGPNASDMTSAVQRVR